MAFPVTQTSSSGAQTTATTSHPVTLPTGISAGDLILVCFSLTDFTGTLTATATAGYTLSSVGRGSAAGNSSPTGYFAWKIATGSDALTFTSSANARSSYVAMRISGAGTVTGSAESHGDNGSGNDPPSLTVASASYKWIAFLDNNGPAVATAAPSGFTNLLTQTCSGASTSTAELDFTGATVDPGAFTSASPSGWTARTIAISGAGGATTNQSCLASTSPVGRLLRSTAKPLTRTTSAVASLIRSTAKALLGSTSPVASESGARINARSLLGSSSPVASLIRSTAKVLTRTTSPVASLVRSAAKALVVSSSPIGTVSRLVAKILRASTSPVASLVIPHAATWYTLRVGDYLVVSGKASVGDKVAFLTSASLSPVLIPTDWDNAHNHVHCTGAGGKGSAAVGIGNSSVGGRGGCYARKDNVTAVANAGTTFSMGDGTTTTGVDTWFDAPTTVLAKGATITNTGSVGDFVSHGGDRDTGAGGGAGGPDGNGTAGIELTVGGDSDNGGDASGGLNASQAGVSGQYWDDGSLTGSIVGFGAGNAATGGVAFLGGNYGGGGSGIEINLSVGTTPGGDGGGGLITLIYTPIPGTTYFQSCLGATAPVARLVRSTAKLIRAATIALALLIRSTARPLTVTTAPIATLKRTVSILRQVTTSSAASLQRGLARTLTVATSAVASLQRGLARTAAVATSAVASLTRAVTPGALRVTTAPVPRLVRTAALVRRSSTTPVPFARHGFALSLLGATAPIARLARVVSKSLAVSTSALAALRRGLVKALQAATVPSASNVRSTAKPLAITTAPAASLARGYFLIRRVSTAAVASLGRTFGKFLQAITAPLATLLLRVFQMPPACRIIYVKARNLVVTVAARNNVAIVPARKNIIVIDSCTACPAVFPARYVGESEIYGFDFTARLREGESIASETVVLTEGDMIVSDIGALAGLVAFRLSGGSPVYQRLVCTITTDATPANVYEAEATITCLP